MANSEYSGNIFIIDSDPTFVSTVKSSLERSNYQVATATNPSEAFQKELSFRPDIFMIDIMLPNESGIELIDEIVKSTENNSFRIISVSELKDENDIERALAVGANDFISKPVHPGELILRVKRQMEELTEVRARERNDSDETETTSKAKNISSSAGMQVGRSERKTAVETPKRSRSILGTLKESSRSMLKSSKILIIDDDRAIRRTVSATLSAKGHHIIQAEDGEQGLSLAVREEPDMIILDILMPRMNGYEVATQLASLPHTAAIPILMLTTQDSPEEIVAGLSGYADDYVTKPFRPDELIARVGALIRRTQRRTREKREQLWIVKNLANKGERRGHRIFSPHIESVPDYPEKWYDPVPDLVTKKRQRTNAYLIESIGTLHDEKTIGRWQDLEECEGLNLVIVGMSRDFLRLASQIKRERGFKAQVRWLKPQKPKSPGWLQKYIKPHHTPYVIAALISLIISLLVLSLVKLKGDSGGISGYIRKQYNIYKPKDIELQLRRTTEELKKIKKHLKR